ncbi:D-amino acid aminotransferase [Dasania marina]|uniref:D-amino acid aminotransferase n=1 Tax=Dasania marina TaxID=471499 RepID=UPI0030DB9DF2|tara:strand:+ start:96407 stop:97264 length:858 start_codon:yes stop_codon:yes gene_type:complete
MSIVYLDGAYMPMAEAKISPMDRGFLFGDGIYEVVPSYDGKMVGFGPHIDRMIEGMGFIDIKLNWSHDQWRDVCDQLIEKNSGDNLGLYLHVSRGTDSKRFHAYPDNVAPTVFAFAFEIPPATVADKAKVKGYKVNTQQDLRWDRCNIKSTALLGNVMHFQAGHAAGMNETLLFNANNELTEASACNAYIVKDGVVITPPLDNQCLPGITRKILLSILAKDGSIKVEERIVTKDEVLNADEVWITSSSKEIAPVTQVDGKPVGNGEVGDVWLAAQTLYSAQKYNY